jgi:hypothetical protein
MTDTPKLSTIAKLNDHARKHGSCRLVATACVSALAPAKLSALMKLVKGYDAFDEAGMLDGNDPHGEHDFGALDFEKVTYFWKFDYYADASYSLGAQNAADPSTARVLTVMLASEY